MGVCEKIYTIDDLKITLLVPNKKPGEFDVIEPLGEVTIIDSGEENTTSAQLSHSILVQERIDILNKKIIQDRDDKEYRLKVTYIVIAIVGISLIVLLVLITLYAKGVICSTQKNVSGEKELDLKKMPKDKKSLRK
jgi:hypothetical protein